MQLWMPSPDHDHLLERYSDVLPPVKGDANVTVTPVAVHKACDITVFYLPPYVIISAAGRNSAGCGKKTRKKTTNTSPVEELSENLSLFHQHRGSEMSGSFETGLSVSVDLNVWTFETVMTVY